MTFKQNFKLPLTKKTKFLLLTATTGTAALTLYTATTTTDSFTNKITSPIHAVPRSSRAISTIALTVADYKLSLRNLPVNSDSYYQKLSEVHLRSAKRMLKLCEENKGFYVKAGQFVASLKQVPQEYSLMLSSLQDQAVPCSFKDIKQVLQSNLDRDLKNIFLSFDEQPVAAASIAQVHRAMLKDHQEVAVKVQYPGLERQMKIDITIMSFLSKSVAWLFPDYRFNWLVTEFREVISSELDFIQEARNSEKTDRNFKNNKFVRIPHIFWELTTRQVLTMQFCWGHKVDDVEFMKETRINPIKVAKALMEVFAEMIFIHGFVHGDPHPGNILVSPEGPNGFTLVILDHGIYKQLDEGFRQDYCQLWKAMILQDTHKIQQLGEQLGAGKYAKYLPVIFLGRSVNSKAILGKGMSDEEKSSLKQELNYLKVDDIFSFMESLPPDFLTILRTDGLLRSVIRKLGAPQHVRLLAYVKYAIRGLSPKLSPGSATAISCGTAAAFLDEEGQAISMHID
ncbi:ABC1 FAMILY PROTEIN [Salix purpurea]|uniref:ABC1 FAMILY PROTEIN n=1 Tax=Salix purpurea TaxID=77065 RepID=A0A9Q0WGC0_SALPP|nr:ABC1 FAMILY PROTEIN [Salix purpurea]